MRIIALCLFVLMFSQFYGQKCETWRGKQINCVDSNGLRQGEWVLFKKKVIMSGYTLGNMSCEYEEVLDSTIKEQGEYKDGSRVGKWWHHSGDYKEYSIEYFEDGSKELYYGFFAHYRLTINPDTSVVTGESQYTINSRFVEVKVNCKVGACDFILSNDKVLLSFDYKHLYEIEYYLGRINSFCYNRQIKHLLWEE